MNVTQIKEEKEKQSWMALIISSVWHILASRSYITGVRGRDFPGEDLVRTLRAWTGPVSDTNKVACL